MSEFDVTELVRNEDGRVFINNDVLIGFISNVDYEFDIEINGLSVTDISDWISPNKAFNFDSSNFNDPECGSPCLNKIIFECSPASDSDIEFSATQLTTDPYRNQPYHCIDFIRESVSDSEIETSDVIDSDEMISFKVSKINFPELRRAIVEALEKHISTYYWCDEYTCRGSYCDHFEDHEKI